MIRRFIVLLLAVFMLMGTAFAEYKELSVGSKDSTDDWAVYSLQLKLIELKYLDGIADGIYGNGTANAVSAFQEDHGLEATGVADVATQELLFSLEMTEDGEAEVKDDTAIEPGEAGNDVFIMQNNLFIWGFITDEPDGIFGRGTRASLKEFQEYTYDDMVAYTEAKRSSATPAPTPESTPEPASENEDGGSMMAVVDDVLLPEIVADGTLTEEWMSYMLNAFDPYVEELEAEDSGKEVKRMQKRLMALGYMGGGADGGFGEHTELALKYFQQLNGLEATGVCDEATQQLLWSSRAVESDKYVSMYKAMVSIDDQRVYIYKWTGKDYTALVHTFICSTGTVENPTILGTFQAPGRNGEWYWMEDSKVWVKYAFVIDGGYFFHSVLFPDQNGEPTSTSVRNLGKRASHGCIRLGVEDAEWIYNNCASGMTVVIYEGDAE